MQKKLIINKLRIFISTAALMLIFCSNTTTAFASDLFSDAPVLNSLHVKETAPDKTVLRSRNVHVDFNALHRNSVVLKLFNNVSYTVLKDRVAARSAENYTWFGRIAGVARSQVILTVQNGSMAGNITLPSGFYQIRNAGNGVHSVRKIDQGSFPDCANTGPAGLIHFPDSTDTAVSSGAADDGSTIDVMVVYTSAAASASSDIQSEIQLAIDETNQSYANSGITQRVNLVHTAQVTYTEPAGSCSIYTYRDRLQNASDGFMDNVHSLRDTYNADLVLLIVENGCGYCGVAYIMDTVSTSFENFGFAVAERSCATGYYSFGHELGHIMSARHDWYVDPTNNSPFTYNHGYVDPDNSWRTVMAYSNACGWCPRIQYWSNPDVLYGGVPMGVPEGSFPAADNRKTLNNTAYTVANFRVSSTGGLPQFYWGDAYGGRLYFAPVDLGIMFGSEWKIIVKTNVDMTSPFGFGFRNYNVSWNGAVQTIFADDNWAGEAMAFQWLGEGTPAYYSLTDGTQGITYLTTTPPPTDVSTSSKADDMN